MTSAMPTWSETRGQNEPDRVFWRVEMFSIENLCVSSLCS